MALEEKSEDYFQKWFMWQFSGEGLVKFKHRNYSVREQLRSWFKDFSCQSHKLYWVHRRSRQLNINKGCFRSLDSLDATSKFHNSTEMDWIYLERVCSLCPRCLFHRALLNFTVLRGALSAPLLKYVDRLVSCPGWRRQTRFKVQSFEFDATHWASSLDPGLCELQHMKEKNQIQWFIPSDSSVWVHCLT